MIVRLSFFYLTSLKKVSLFYVTISNRKQVSHAIMKHIPAFLFFFFSYKGFERMEQN